MLKLKLFNNNIPSHINRKQSFCSYFNATDTCIAYKEKFKSVKNKSVFKQHIRGSLKVTCCNAIVQYNFKLLEYIYIWPRKILSCTHLMEQCNGEPGREFAFTPLKALSSCQSGNSWGRHTRPERGTPLGQSSFNRLTTVLHIPEFCFSHVSRIIPWSTVLFLQKPKIDTLAEYII